MKAEHTSITHNAATMALSPKITLQIVVTSQEVYLCDEKLTRSAVFLSSRSLSDSS